MEMRPGESRQGGQEARSQAAPSVPAPAVTEATWSTAPLPVPEAVRDAARRAPGHWVGIVDPEWTGQGTPPAWAVPGEWQSDEDGGVGDYRANPAYRPSARVLGWPEPTDPVDEAAQRAATGYGTVEVALAALAEAEVTVVRGSDGTPLRAPGTEGAPVVLAFTAAAHAFLSDAVHHDTVTARDLARSLSGTGTMLMVNAGAAAPLLVPSDALLHAPGPADAGAESAPEPWPHTTGRNP
ncbi:type VII secretion system-associated protein [Streptomyces griseoluteus]